MVYRLLHNPSLVPVGLSLGFETRRQSHWGYFDQIPTKFAMLWFKMCWTDHSKMLHTSRQYHCRDVSKISLWLAKYFMNKNFFILQFDQNIVSGRVLRHWYRSVAMYCEVTWLVEISAIFQQPLTIPCTYIIADILHVVSTVQGDCERV